MFSSSDRDVATALLAPDYLTAVQKNDNEVIKRLRSAQRLLEKAEQGEEEPHELFHFAKQLGQPWLLSHKHKSIRCLVACCISDILRLYAPNPPYDPDLLKHMFELFFQQLRLLSENDENFPKRFALLESLATLKMPLLLVELCGASDDTDRDDSPLLSLFDTILGVQLPKGVPTSAVPFQVDILASVVSELNEISPAMLDSLLKRLLPAEKAENPEAAEVAKETLKLCAARLMPVVSELLTRSSATSVSELSDRKTSSELIFQLSQIDPEYLLYVLPSVCRDLQDEDVDSRSSTVDLLGRMFLANHTLITKFHKNFVEFLARFHDKEASIRCALVTFGAQLLLACPSVSPILSHELRQRVTDIDASVRLLVVKSVCDIACVPGNLCSVPCDLLYEVVCRVMDKKSEVQLEAIKGASQLFFAHLSEKKWSDSEFFTASSSDDADVLAKVMIVPGMLLHCYAECESAFVRFRVMQVFEKLVLPTELNSECRARGLLTIFAALAPTEKLAFATMLKDKHGMQKAVDRFLQVRTDKSDAVTDALMDIARRLPAQDEAFANLQELLDYKDKLIFTGLDRLCTANLPLSETVRITEDVCSRVGMRNDKKVLSVMKLVLRMVVMETIDVGMTSALVSDVVDGSLHLLGSVDKSVEPPSYVAEQVDAKAEAMELLLLCASQFPDLLESSIDDLVTIACADVKRTGSPKDGVSASAMKLLALFIAHAMQSSAKSVDRPIDDTAVGKLVKVCGSGSLRQAKYAGKTLAVMIGSSSDALTPGSSRIGDVLSRAMREWLPRLSSSPANLDTTVTALSEFALCAPLWFLSNRGSDALVFAEKCVNDGVHAMSCGKLLVNIVRGLFTVLPSVPATRRASLQAEAKQRGVVAWRVVFQCLASTTVELKRAASQWALRMCRHVSLDNALTADRWLILAQLPQGDDPSVARVFSKTLMKELNRAVLPVRFLAAAMLAAESYTPRKGGIQGEMRTIVRKYRLRHSAAVHAAASGSTPVNPVALYKLSPLACLPFAVHLLSHLPSFPALEEWQAATDVSSLSRHVQQALSFLLDALVYEGKTTPDASANGSIAMLLHMLSTMKSCDDALDPANIGMHITSELATQILKDKIKDAASLAGTKFEVYLPPSLFKPAATARVLKLPEAVAPPESPDADTSAAKHRRTSGSPLKRAMSSTGRPPKAAASRTIAVVSSDSESEIDDGKVGDEDDSEEDARKKRKTVTKKAQSSTKENKSAKPVTGKKGATPSEALRRARPSRAASSVAVSYYVEGSSEDLDEE